jgi:glycerophosphoryl diester phosphodiesterase
MKLFKLVFGIFVALVLAIGLALVPASSALAGTPPAKCTVAHRGIGPENAIGSHRRAINKGACGTEADARFTRDNVCILNHDSTLNRSTTGKGRVTSRSWRDVSRLHIRKHSWGKASHARVATCHQYLVLCRDTRAQVCLLEAKRGATPEQVRSIARDAIATLGTAVTKFILETDTYRDTRIITSTPEFATISVGFVGFRRWPSVSDVQASGADGIIVDRKVMSYARVASARQRGLWVMPYTIETFRELRHVRRMGADGAMTDVSRLFRY